MTAIQTEVFEDADQLARSVAERVVALAGDTVSRKGSCVIALAGGSTPKRLYQLLATDEFRDQIDWSSLHIFVSDERHVPLDHPESNFGMAQETLLTHVSVPDDQVHSVGVDFTPADAAAAYEHAIRTALNASGDDVPQFDLILLGIGGDGHTASLFPGTAALEVRDRLVAENWVPQQDSMRISFTIPLLQAARETILMATGEDKADAVARTIEGEPDLNETPSQLLRDAQGPVIFALDRAAASKLSR